MYGKIFESMYDGSLYGQWEALVTFQQMIVLADKEGFVDITPPALSARTGIPLDIITKGITILESDDPYSRTEGENGKRLVLINPNRPWGWRIVNYEKYRDMASLEDRREYMRDYMKEYRKQEKFTDKQVVNKGKPPLAVLAHTDVDVDTDVKDIGKVKKFIPPAEKDVVNYFHEKGFRIDVARKAFDYYDTANWKDARGNQVKNWKQKLIANWFKPENKKSDKHPSQSDGTF